MIAEITSLLTVSKMTISFLKDMKELIPDEDKKNEIEQRIKTVERELALAEAGTAKELGYDLCKCTFPPQIMLFTGKGRIFKCQRCKHEINNSMECITAPIKDRGYE